jgi:hypothetical protein
MYAQNGTPQRDHPAFEAQIDALKSGVKNLLDRMTTKPTWFGALVTRTTETVKAHPVAAIALAAGLGYLVVKIVRR